MKIKLFAWMVFFCIFNFFLIPHISFAGDWEYGDDLEVLKEQFQTPFKPNQQEVDFRGEWLKTIDQGLQKRDPEKLVWSNFLSHLARKRAEDSIRYGWAGTGHMDQKGWYAGTWGIELGYDFGASESLYTGGHRAKSAVRTFMDSPGHRVHLLGEGYTQLDSFYAIGYASSADGRIGVFTFISSHESKVYTDEVKTHRKPTVWRFEGNLTCTQEGYNYVIMRYKFRNLKAGKYSAEWSKDLSSWKVFEDFKVEVEDLWREVVLVTKNKPQVYLRIVKKPTTESVQTNQE